MIFNAAVDSVRRQHDLFARRVAFVSSKGKKEQSLVNSQCSGRQSDVADGANSLWILHRSNDQSCALA